MERILALQKMTEFAADAFLASTQSNHCSSQSNNGCSSQSDQCGGGGGGGGSATGLTELEW